MNWTAGFPLGEGRDIDLGRVRIHTIHEVCPTAPRPALPDRAAGGVAGCGVACAGHHRNRDREWAEWVHTTLAHDAQAYSAPLTLLCLLVSELGL